MRHLPALILLFAVAAGAPRSAAAQPPGRLPLGTVDTRPSADVGRYVQPTIRCSSTRLVVHETVECLATPSDATRFLYYWMVRGERGRAAGFDEGRREPVLHWNATAPGRYQLRLSVRRIVGHEDVPVERTLMLDVQHDGGWLQRAWRSPWGRLAAIAGTAVGMGTLCRSTEVC